MASATIAPVAALVRPTAWPALLHRRMHCSSLRRRLQALFASPGWARTRSLWTRVMGTARRWRTTSARCVRLGGLLGWVALFACLLRIGHSPRAPVGFAVRPCVHRAIAPCRVAATASDFPLLSVYSLRLRTNVTGTLLQASGSYVLANRSRPLALVLASCAIANAAPATAVKRSPKAEAEAEVEAEKGCERHSAPQLASAAAQARVPMRSAGCRAVAGVAGSCWWGVGYCLP